MRKSAAGSVRSRSVAARPSRSAPICAPCVSIVSGDFTTSGSGALSVTDGNASTPASTDVLSFWKNLRIYGRAGTPSSESHCNQNIKMSGSSSPYGFAMWFPLGDVTISGGGKKAQPDFFGTVWTCKIDKISGNSSVLVPKDAVKSPGTRSERQSHLPHHRSAAMTRPSHPIACAAPQGCR